MKLEILAFFVAGIAAPTSAFVPVFGGGRVRTSLASVRPDTSSAIEAALEASKKYGASSPEARVAWDAVEEMDASDNSAAYKGSLDDSCPTEEEISKACEEYGDKLDALADLVNEYGPKLDTMKSLAEEMQSIKLSVTKAKPASDSPEVRAALESARKATEEFGADSPEARVAWTELEDVAASGLGNAMGTRLDEECLVESTMEACVALDELNRALNLQKTKNEGLNA